MLPGGAFHFEARNPGPASYTSDMGASKRTLVQLLFLLSGAAGLIYQVVWMRKLVLVLGVTSQAVSTVLAVFMAGLALGSWLLARRADKTRSALALYGWLELGIAIFGALSIPMLDASLPIYVQLTRGADWSAPALGLLRLTLASAILLIPTTLMGATLPILVRAITTNLSRLGRDVGALYALNTLGAALGTLFAGFYLIEAVGLRATSYVAAGLNAIAAVGAFILTQQTQSDRALELSSNAAGQDETEVRLQSPATETTPGDRGLARHVLLAFALCGFVALAYEVLWTRYLIYVLGQNSVYAFSTMLVCFLLGIVLGSAVAGIISDRSRHLLAWLGGTILLTGVAALGTLAVMGLLVRERRVGGDGATWLAVTAGDFLRCMAVLLPPTILSGATFPLVARLYAARPKQLGADVGRAYAVNTLGSILGALAGGFAILPVLGLRLGLGALAAIQVLTGLSLLLRKSKQARAARANMDPASGPYPKAALGLGLIAAAGFGSLFFLPDPHRLILEGPGREILMYHDGPESSVAIVKNWRDEIQIFVDGDGQASTEPRTQVHLRLLGHLPALLHPNPRTGLVVGFGGGITTGCLAQHPLDRLDLVELNPAVRKWAVHWEAFNHDPLHNEKVNLIQDDGRNYLLTTDQTYDVVTSDPIDPDDAGVTSLYSKEYYELVREHLNPGGVAAQWITAHYDTDVYRTLVKTFQEVFPHTTVWFAYYTTVLVGHKDGPQLSFSELEQRLSNSEILDSLSGIGVERPEHVLSLLLAGPQGSRQLAGGAPLNTDDRPRIEYAAPKWTGTGEESGGVALALCELQRPAWDSCLSEWTKDQAQRIDAGFGWVQLLLERDILELDYARSADTGLDRDAWILELKERGRMARESLNLTFGILARDVPPMAVQMAGIHRIEPPEDTPLYLYSAYEQWMANGLADLAAGNTERAALRFQEARDNVPGTLRPAILLASLELPRSSLSALKQLLAADFQIGDRLSPAGQLPFQLVDCILVEMLNAGDNAAAKGASGMDASAMGAALAALMPPAGERPLDTKGPGFSPRPTADKLGSAPAWTSWWRDVRPRLWMEAGRFVWVP